MSDDDLLCPFCQKKVGLAGMYVAHIIKCGKNQIAKLQAAVDEAITLVGKLTWPVKSQTYKDLGKWFRKWNKSRSQYEPTDEGEVK